MPVIQIILSWHPVSTEFLLPSHVALVAASGAPHGPLVGGQFKLLKSACVKTIGFFLG